MGTEPALPLLSVYPLHPAEQTPHTFLLSCGHDLPRQLWGVPSRCTQQVITHLPTSKTGVSVKSQAPCVAFVPDPESGPTQASLGHAPAQVLKILFPTFCFSNALPLELQLSPGGTVNFLPRISTTSPFRPFPQKTLDAKKTLGSTMGYLQCTLAVQTVRIK